MSLSNICSTVVTREEKCIWQCLQSYSKLGAFWGEFSQYTFPARLLVYKF